MENAVFESNISGLKLNKRGKVRDVYSVGNKTHLIIIATDRISAFDFVLPSPIPKKGIILTQLSNFWFERTKHIIQIISLTLIRHKWIGIMRMTGATMR